MDLYYCRRIIQLEDNNQVLISSSCGSFIKTAKVNREQELFVLREIGMNLDHILLQVTYFIMKKNSLKLMLSSSRIHRDSMTTPRALINLRQ